MEQQGYYHETNSIGFETLGNPALYNVGLYARFSKDDGQAYDSSSIETQKFLLEKFCKDNGYKVFRFYKDDGYSGLNFDRPDFQNLLKDIGDGKVNLVITKDLSRLGRDYILTGHYIENYFVENNVRYIAVNDGVDTVRADNDFVPFKNIFNNLYSKDISKKVKSAKRQRALHGLFINPQPPYGYKKHPDNRNKLIVDEEAAEVVKEIFQLALEGKGKTAIAKALTTKRVIVPSAYKTAHGIRGFGHFNGKRKADYDYTWKYSTILNILRDRAYVGDMVNHRHEVVNYKTKKLATMPREKHIVVENTHEPIVSRDDFERVQELITARYMPPKNRQENIFRGILFCAGCGKRMSLSHQTIKSKGKAVEKKPIFRCKTHYGQNADECVRNNYIYYDDLYNQILSAVKRVITLISDDEAALRSVQKQAAAQRDDGKLTAEKGRIEKRLATLTAVLRKLYEDCVTGVLDGGNYQSLLAGCQREQKQLNDRLTAINGELGRAGDGAENFKKLRNYAAAYADATGLTAEMLNRLIERIEIGYPTRANGKTRQAISIIYRFVNTVL